MNVTLRQLQIFAQVAETGNFTRASEELFLTQPAVSQQMRLLAETVGEPLVEVIGRAVHLTDAGRSLLDTWRQMEQQWRFFEEDLAFRRGLHRGTLRLAAVSTAKYFVPRLLGPFCRKHPGIDVKLEVANRDNIIDRIGKNLDDLYIMSRPPESLDLVSEPFLENPLVAIASPDHPFASRKRIRLREFARERFIMREAGSGTRIAIEDFQARHGVTFNVRMELGSNEAIKQAVAGGLGLSIVSRHSLHRLPVEEDEVSILPVEGFPLLTQWQLVYLGKKRLPPAARAFLSELAEWIPQYLSSKGID
jgi:DNA-binding transcriptional LysR family regulator